VSSERGLFVRNLLDANFQKKGEGKNLRKRGIRRGGLRAEHGGYRRDSQILYLGRERASGEGEKVPGEGFGGKRGFLGRSIA